MAQTVIDIGIEDMLLELVEKLAKMQRTIEVVYEKGVFKPLEKVEIPEETKIPIKLTRGDALKRYRGILGKIDEKLLKEFELEANDIY